MSIGKTASSKAPDVGQPLFTVEGRIEQLRKAPGTVNLIEDIQKRILVPGVAAALAGQAGMLANAASLALYDGEDVEHFAFLINGQLAVGTFEWIEDINNGDQVKLVVSDQDGVLCVHALLRNSDQLLWMPHSTIRTRRGLWMYSAALWTVGSVTSWLLLLAISLFISSPNVVAQMLWIGTGAMVVAAFAVGMSLRGSMHLGVKAEAIYKALDVPRADHFNLRRFGLSRMTADSVHDPNLFRKGHIFKFADAIAAHIKGRNS